MKRKGDPIESSVKRSRPRVSDTFNSIYDAFDVNRSESVAIHVRRLSAFMSHTPIEPTELSVFIELMQPRRVRHKTRYQLASVVERHAQHLNRPDLPFTRLFADILKSDNEFYAANQLYMRTGGLVRLLRRAWPDVTYPFPSLLVLQPKRNMFTASEDACQSVVDAAKYLRVVLPFAALYCAFGVVGYSTCYDSNSVQKTNSFGSDTRLCDAILDSWAAARYHGQATIPENGLECHLIAVVGHWHQTQSWPTPKHRELTYRLAHWLRVTVHFEYLFERYLYIFKHALPIFAAGSVRFDLTKASESYVREFVQTVRHELEQHTARSLRVWNTIVRAMVSQAFSNNETRMAPFVHDPIRSHIVAYLRSKTRSVTDVVYNAPL